MSFTKIQVLTLSKELRNIILMFGNNGSISSLTIMFVVRQFFSFIAIHVRNFGISQGTKSSNIDRLHI